MIKDRLIKILRKGTVHFLLIFICVLFILPLLWVVSTSLRAPGEVYTFPPSFFPTEFNLTNYRTVVSKFPMWMFVRNSILVAVTVVLINVIITTMSAYSFARIPFKGNDIVFIMFLSGLMIPAQATIIPVYILMSKIGLVGNLWSIILPAIINPMSIFFVRQFMKTIPASYEDAAYIDGASRFQIYLQIMLPMSKSVIAMIALQNFMSSWNNFLAPLIFLSDWEKMTLPMGLKVLQGYNGNGTIGVVFAGVTISFIIPLLMYIFGQKHFLNGAVLSGLKG